jgi:hypothetical protein
VKFVYHLNRAGSVGFVPSPDVIGMSPIGGGRPAKSGHSTRDRNPGAEAGVVGLLALRVLRC